jgi:hypothetical protein
MPKADIRREDITGKVGIMDREVTTVKAVTTGKVGIMDREDIVPIAKAVTTGKVGIMDREDMTADM